MIRRLALALQRLSARERRMLAVLALAGLPLAALFGVALPLAEARARAEAQVATDAALAGWVAARAAEMALVQAQGDARPDAPAAAIGISRLEQSLVAAGLREAVTRLSNRQDGQLDLSFDEVRFSALAGWLQAVEPGWGYRITALRLEALEEDASGGTGDLVSAEFSLRPGEVR